MREQVALEAAVELLHMPSRARSLRNRDLPPGMTTLLGVVAGDEAALELATKAMGQSEAALRSASAFFIEQVLFHPEADSYRVLGAHRTATSDELRQNVALLLRWLHPDLDRGQERSIYVGRVTGAWNDLKTVERRSNYDTVLARADAEHAERKAWEKARRDASHRSHGRRSLPIAGAGGLPEAARGAATAGRKAGLMTRILRRFLHRADL